MALLGDDNVYAASSRAATSRTWGPDCHFGPKFWGGNATPKSLEVRQCDCYHTNYNGIVVAWPQMCSCTKDLSHLVPMNCNVIFLREELYGR